MICAHKIENVSHSGVPKVIKVEATKTKHKCLAVGPLSLALWVHFSFLKKVNMVVVQAQARIGHSSASGVTLL